MLEGAYCVGEHFVALQCSFSNCILLEKMTLKLH